MAISKLISRLKKALGWRCVQEQPCVPLKFTTSMAKNRPQSFKETPAQVGEVDDGGGKETGRKKKKRSLWKHFLPLCKRATEKYKKAPAELYENTAAGHTDGQISVQDNCIIEIHDLQEAPISSSKMFHTTEDHLEQEVIVDTPESLSSDDDIDSPVSPTADGDFNTAVKSTVVISIDSSVSLSADNNTDSTAVHTECAVTPKADEDFESAVNPTADNDIESVVSPTEHKDIESEVFATEDVTDSVKNKEPDKNHIGWRYKVGEMLGEGGFGSVYEGIRYQDGLQVAVKFAVKTPHTTHLSVSFHPTPLPSEIALAAIASRGPSCPHIIQLLDWQDYPDRYVMVMERPLPSMDLVTFLQLSGGFLSEHTAQYIMWQVIYASNVCCYRGVFHRDIKLENLLVNPSTLEVKLIDFGCGDLMKDSSYETFSGTRVYCPPEYFERGRYHAKPATVYSLGVLLFTMLHGRYPTDYDIYLINTDWSKLGFSRECCHLLWSCLQRNPEHRLLLEHMHYHDWFLLKSPDHQNE